MRTLRIDVSDSIREQVEKLFKVYSTVNPFQNIEDPVIWQKSIRNEWK